MISIGSFVGDDKGLDFVNNVGRFYPIHIGFFGMQSFWQYSHQINSSVKISSVHLPAFIKDIDTGFIDLLSWCKDRIQRKPIVLVMHPNKKLYEIVEQLIGDWPNITFAIENFSWKSRKFLKTPIDILIHNEQNAENYGFCFDTSHVNKSWIQPPILSSIIPRASIIHLSNSNGAKDQHRPFRDGDKNLMWIIDFIKKKRIDVEIVLEYLAKYKKEGHCERDYDYLWKYLGYD